METSRQDFGLSRETAQKGREERGGREAPVGRRLECELHPQWFTFFRIVCALEREVENCVLSHSHSSHGFVDFLTSVFLLFLGQGLFIYL